MFTCIRRCALQWVTYSIVPCTSNGQCTMRIEAVGTFRNTHCEKWFLDTHLSPRTMFLFVDWLKLPGENCLSNLTVCPNAERWGKARFPITTHQSPRLSLLFINIGCLFNNVGIEKETKQTTKWQPHQKPPEGTCQRITSVSSAPLLSPRHSSSRQVQHTHTHTQTYTHLGETHSHTHTLACAHTHINTRSSPTPLASWDGRSGTMGISSSCGIGLSDKCHIQPNTIKNTAGAHVGCKGLIGALISISEWVVYRFDMKWTNSY